MNTEYRAITKEENATVQIGDQCKLISNGQWQNISCATGLLYSEEFNFTHFEYRRPTAISTSPFDSTNVSNEFEEASEKALVDAMVTGTGFIQVSHVPVEEVFKQDKPQEWDGEGWPPIGADCEIQTTGDYFEARIDYIDWIHCIFTSKKRNATTTYRKIKELKFRPIKPEPTEAEKDLQCEIDMINAYLEQIDSSISDYDVQMFAQYVQDRLKGGDDHE